jgi:altronate dehydratase
MLAAIQFPVFAARRGPASEQVGLILPTSLCAGQIAQIAARRLNAQGIGRQRGITRFVALAHTEGCGASTSPERLYPRTMLGYMTHPAVSACLLLEHGCEVTHNDYMREQMRQAGLDLAEFGWASIQLDGGIDKVLAKIERWFNLHAADTHPPRRRTGGLETLRIALNAAGLVSPQAGKLCARLAQTVVEGGGVVITPENSPLWHNAAFTHELGIVEPRATLAYAQPAEQAGLHVMATPTQHWVETLVGMGAGGTQLFLAHVGQQPMPGHPLVPLLQITSEAQVAASYSADLDLSLIGAEGMANGVEQALHLVQQTMAGGYTPAAERIGNLDFQLTRGLLTVSL